MKTRTMVLAAAILSLPCIADAQQMTRQEWCGKAFAVMGNPYIAQEARQAMLEAARNRGCLAAPLPGAVVEARPEGGAPAPGHRYSDPGTCAEIARQEAAGEMVGTWAKNVVCPTAAEDPTEKRLRCSKEADQRGLHDEARHAFRANCIAGD